MAAVSIANRRGGARPWVFDERSKTVPVDLAAISPEARRRYIRIGRRYKTPNVLAQADQSVQALEQYGAIVALHGFGAEEQERFVDGRVMLQGRQEGKDQAVAQRSITGQTYEVAVENGKAARQTARTTLQTIDKSATEKGEIDVATLVRTALTQTSLLPEDRLLVDHLSILHTAVRAPIVVPFVISRGGVDFTQRLQTARDNLRAAQSARAGHNPVTSVAEERDLLDGMLVSLARSARDAAKAAARHLGQPSIAAAFKLNHLRRSSSVPQDPEIDDGDDSDGDDSDAPITQPGAPTAPGK